MNLQTFTRVKIFTKWSFFGILCVMYMSHEAWADWKFDFSRRTTQTRKSDYVANSPDQNEPHLLNMVFKSDLDPVNEIVLLNTEKGFVPSTFHVREGKRYKVTIVNVNKENKNISFVLDAFSEHHSTYYGTLKSFYIEPKKEGVYSYQCPETAAQGKIVVYSKTNDGSEALPLRVPASE